MADAFEDEAEQTMTIGEYIEGIEADELKADLVLGGDEGKECTYSKGYMKRQAIFSCLTCVPAGNAGICTACSLSCHDGHEVVELWTKRKFKCDCGNSKFGVFVCKLWPNKDPENGENSYNQNFKGSYCTCGRPYPDPDSKKQIESIQCCICEDWFHENHLGLDSLEQMPRDEEGEPLYDEFICQECAVACCFLKLYPIAILASSNQKTAPVHAESGTAAGEKDGENAKKEQDVEKDNACSRNQSSNSTCILGIDINSTSVVFKKKEPMFLSKNWRDLLCRCSTCCDCYTQKGIAYLIDKEDSLEEYEKMAKQKREEKLQQQEGAELNFLNTLDHIQKMEILSGIADMKNEFQSFLDSFDTSKPITAEDVRGIFENLVKKKKQRLL